jgi:hypothetical protein
MVVGDAEGIAEKLEGVDVGVDVGAGASDKGGSMNTKREGPGVDILPEGPAVGDIKINAVEGITVVELKLRNGTCVDGLGDGGGVDTCNEVSLLAR